MNGQQEEYKQIQNIQDALMNINGSFKRLNIDTQQVELSLPSEDFNYLKLVIENTDEHKFKKFYQSVSKECFVLAGIRVVKYQKK